MIAMPVPEGGADEAAFVAHELGVRAEALTEFADLVETTIRGPLSPRFVAAMARAAAADAEDAAEDVMAPYHRQAAPADAPADAADGCGEPACVCHDLAAAPADEDEGDEDLAAIEDLIRDIRYRRRRAART